MGERQLLLGLASLKICSRNSKLIHTQVTLPNGTPVSVDNHCLKTLKESGDTAFQVEKGGWFLKRLCCCVSGEGKQILVLNK